MFKFQRWFIFSIAFFCFAQVTIDPTTPEITDWLNFSSAQAKGGRSSSSSSRSSSSSSSSSSRSSSTTSSPSRSSSPHRSPSKSATSGNTGGRTRGGSFDRKPSPAPTSPSTTTPTRPSSLPSTRPSYPSREYRPSYPSREYRPSGPTYINPEIEIEIENDYDDYPYPSNPQQVPAPYPSNPQQVPAPYPSNPQQVPAPYPSNPQQVPAPYVPDGTQVQPVPPNDSTTVPTSTIPIEAEDDGFPWEFVFFLLFVGGGLFLTWYLLSKRGRGSSGSSSELTNDTVTVTRLQVALLAEARDIQLQLTELSTTADLDTPEGLSEFLQETALSLLRKPEYWSYGQSSSQTVTSREEAGQMFEQMSIAERSKFEVETFSRVNDRTRSRSISVEPDIEPPEYIVVTLLVGTEDDRPLFDPIYSTEDLKQALERLATIPPNSLAIFELLWSPQVSTDSLSSDELLTKYAELVPLG